MEILVCIQHNFVMACGVMLHSLMSNNTKTRIIVHCICNSDVTEEDKCCLRDIVERYSTSKMFFYTFPTYPIEKYPALKRTHFAVSNYYRLFCSSILPANISKVLYLDSDMIVLDSLCDLWKEELDKYAVAGVQNPLVQSSKVRIMQYLGDKDVYVNSGVLIINLKYWRENALEKKFIDFVEKSSNWIRYADQDVINVVLKEKIKSLPLKYNFQHQFLYKDKYLEPILDSQFSELQNAREKPVIVHFTGPDKPWMAHCYHPLKFLFIKFQEQTIWRGKVISIPKSVLINRKIRGQIVKLKYFLKFGRFMPIYIDSELCKSINKKFMIDYEKKWN